MMLGVSISGRKFRVLKFGSLLAAFVLYAAVAVTTSAQVTGSATLRGTVKDPKGAVVPNATVTRINEGTKAERDTKSNDEGQYVFTAVVPGTYTVKVEASGFKTTNQSGVSVEAASTRALDVELAVGLASETVTVVSGSAADQLQTETGARENTITADQIKNLSLVSRSALELLRILPG